MTLKVQSFACTVETFLDFADFCQIRESLSREQFGSSQFAKVYVRKIF